VEQLIDAAALLPGAVLALMGYGDLRAVLAERARLSPAADRIRFLDPVAPADLIAWISGADVCAMPIQGTTLNHRLATPNKLFEAIGAGVPVVVSDLPGMAAIVREHGVGETCDPAEPADVARAIRAIVECAPADRAALRQRCLDVARERFNWEAQAERLVALYTSLGVPPPGGR
jgi:glycosyltransferase involved in cell wall biosynthesis